jgi:hypothetical protein
MNYFARLAVVAALCIAPSASFAGGTSVGIKGGLAISNYVGSDATLLDPIARACGYFFLNNSINPSFNLELGVGYINKGTTLGKAYYEDLGYIELPVLFRIC